MKQLCTLLLCLFSLVAYSKTWYVGPSRTYSKPSEVSSLVSNGDSILIDPVEYIRDVCIWRADGLYISGNNGVAHLNADHTAYGGKAIWVVAGNNTTIERIAFSNCTVVDRNGAGIRQEGNHLTVRYCQFLHNEDGILAGDNPESNIVVEFCEFGYNGAGDGYSHNIYINHVHSLLFQYNYVHHAYYGHEVKSRAYTNIILYNRITNEDGDASYEIDVPNGGKVVVFGNVIQQSKFSDNNTIISYGREGLTNPAPHCLYVLQNTFVNNEDKGILLNVQSKMDTVVFSNNLVGGNLTLLSGIPLVFIKDHNVIRQDISLLKFKDANTYNYYLEAGSPAVDSGSILPVNFPGVDVSKLKEYVHPGSYKDRYNDGMPDAGAFELQQISSVREHIRSLPLAVQMIGRTIYIAPDFQTQGSLIEVRLFNLSGELLQHFPMAAGEERTLIPLPPGLYLIQFEWDRKSYAACVPIWN